MKYQKLITASLDRQKKFKAFLSYSHAADESLAADVQSALHKFAKPWTWRTAIRTFRDTTNLAVTPSLWGSIIKALDDSEFFILMASPEAARSAWVKKEVTHWLKTRAQEDMAENFMIVLTEGSLVWNSDLADFDWDRTNALPAALKGVFHQEPKYVDLSWAKATHDRSLRNLQFRGAIAELATPLHGRDKDELDGEDVRQHNKLTRFRKLAFLTVFVLFIVSIATMIFALIQSSSARQSQRRAEESATIAQQRQKEAEAQTQIAFAERENARRQTQIADDRKKEAERQGEIAKRNERLAQNRRRDAVRQTAEAQRKNYLANIAYVMSVDESTRVSEFEGIRNRLDSLDKPLRSWEWNHLDLKSDSSSRIIQVQGALGDVEDVIFSSDGKQIASVARDQTIRIWDANTGTNRLTFLASENLDQHSVVSKLAFSPDGSRIASGAADGNVCVWDSVSGVRLWDLKSHHSASGYTGPIIDLGFSSDGTTMFSLTPTEFAVWDAKSGANLRSFESTKDGGSFVAVDQAGLMVLETISGKDEISVRNSKTGGKLVTLPGDGASIQIAKFSPDGTMLAAACVDRKIRIWDLKSLSLKFAFAQQKTWVEQLAFGVDGLRVAACSYEGIRVWNLKTGDQITLLQGHRGTVKTLAFSPDSNVVASAGTDNTLRIWRVNLASNITLPQTDRVGNVAMTRDGRYIAVGERLNSDSRVFIYDEQSLQPVKELTCRVGSIVELKFSPNGQQLAVVGSSGVVRIFKSTSGEFLGTLSGDHAVSTVAFSANGDLVATGAQDGYMAIFKAGTWKPEWQLTGHGGLISQLEFSRDSTQLVSASWDQSIKLWQAQTGTLVKTLKGHEGSVTSVAFSPDGSRIASGSLDETVKIWRVLDGTPDLTLSGHTGGVTAAIFSVDGMRVFSGSTDASVRIWNAQTGEPIVVLGDAGALRNWDIRPGIWGWRNAQFGIQGLALSSDGTRLVAGLTEITKTGDGPRGYLLIWNSMIQRDQSVTISPPDIVERFQKAFTQSGNSRPGFLEYERNRGKRRGHELRFEPFLALSDHSIESYMRRGRAYFDRSDYELAVDDFTEVLKRQPKNSDAFAGRASAFYFNDDFEAALSDLDNAVALGVKNLPRYLVLRASIYLNVRNEPDKALSDLNTSIQLDDSWSLLYRERGRVHMQKREYVRAISDLTTAIQLEPSDSRLYTDRAIAHYRNNDLDHAARDFEKAIKMENASAGGYYNLACVLFDSGRFEDAYSLWIKSLELEPKFTRSLAGLAIAVDALNRPKDALRAFEVLIRNDRRFLLCEKELKDDFFWSRSGCRAIAPLAERFWSDPTNRVRKAPPR